MIGRNTEKRFLQSLIYEDESQFVAVFGRRRIGKAYLVRESYLRPTCMKRHILFSLSTGNNIFCQKMSVSVDGNFLYSVIGLYIIVAKVRKT